MSRRPTVERDMCMGSGMCVVYAPNTFAHDEETIAVVTDPAGDSAEDIGAAIDACPTGALLYVTDKAAAETGD